MRKKLLILLGAIIFILLFSVLWSANKVGGYVGSVDIPRAFVCKEIKQNSVPQSAAKFNLENEQVCLWFEYVNAKSDTPLKIVCYMDKTEIVRQRVVLVAKEGVRAYYLVKNDGSPLPPGKYRIVISTATKSWVTKPEVFEVTDSQSSAAKTPKKTAAKQSSSAQKKPATTVKPAQKKPAAAVKPAVKKPTATVKTAQKKPAAAVKPAAKKPTATVKPAQKKPAAAVKPTAKRPAAKKNR